MSSSDVVLLAQLAARIALACLFVAAGILHFVPPVLRTMTAMIPPRLRFSGFAQPRNLVILTGVCEIAGGVGLLVAPLTLLAGISLIVFLVAVFPANAYIAGDQARFGLAAFPLIPRAIAQLALMLAIAWAIS
jgi:uncharacterized membrane protein